MVAGCGCLMLFVDLVVFVAVVVLRDNDWNADNNDDKATVKRPVAISGPHQIVDPPYPTLHTSQIEQLQGKVTGETGLFLGNRNSAHRVKHQVFRGSQGGQRWAARP